MVSRKEHIEWCKQRAREYIAINQLDNAFTSFISDMGKHPETSDHPVFLLGIALIMAGKMETEKEVSEFIEGTH